MPKIDRILVGMVLNLFLNINRRLSATGELVFHPVLADRLFAVISGADKITEQTDRVLPLPAGFYAASICEGASRCQRCAF
ncbi:hypothetical protein [Paraburkholderia dioscoreae]|uniref:hypothetical protein n=1 Tax=Paraburkholderia dioscoreae TaxID=2604047 RepID=UPI0013EC9B31|nr:hypothetical protein [Paraburkholderia dioscoreae]